MLMQDVFNKLKAEYTPVNIFMANNYDVWKPFRLYESDLRRYCMVVDQGGVVNFVLAPGQQGFARFLEKEFDSLSGDKIIDIIDLTTQESISFQWKLEVPIPL